MLVFLGFLSLMKLSLYESSFASKISGPLANYHLVLIVFSENDLGNLINTVVLLTSCAEVGGCS